MKENPRHTEYQCHKSLHVLDIYDYKTIPEPADPRRSQVKGMGT